MTKGMNTMLQEKFKRNDLIYGIYNSKVSLNRNLIDSLKLDHEEIKKEIINFLSADSAVANVFDISKIDQVILNEKIKKMFINGHYVQRSGEIQIILHPQWLEYFSGTGTTHGTWYTYDAHIPLVWYGWGVKPGKLNQEVYMTDIAPTLAALLHIQMPNGCVGSPINELIK
jgi:hypothetical protein